MRAVLSEVEELRGYPSGAHSQTPPLVVLHWRLERNHSFELYRIRKEVRRRISRINGILRGPAGGKKLLPEGKHL